MMIPDIHRIFKFVLTCSPSVSNLFSTSIMSFTNSDKPYFWKSSAFMKMLDLNSLMQFSRSLIKSFKFFGSYDINCVKSNSSCRFRPTKRCLSLRKYVKRNKLCSWTLWFLPEYGPFVHEGLCLCFPKVYVSLARKT